MSDQLEHGKQCKKANEKESGEVFNFFEPKDSELLMKLKKYAKSDAYPFHMPGHKRRDPAEVFKAGMGQTNGKTSLFQDFPNPYGIDITEIDGFDNLHHAEGILRDSMEEAAEIYGADHSYYLVNGSTCGILSAICGCTKVGGKILMARDCHKAAYHGAILHQLETEYLYPEYLEQYGINGGILAEDVRAALEKNCMMQAVLIVSPTYEGVVSDIQAIADVVHEYGIPLIVDEAHGAHLPFCDQESKFPKSALDCGADVVIQSLHKTLPSFTQTAIMHLRGDLVSRTKIERYLGMFQSSSPSYLFMASMERCVVFMDGPGREEMKRYEGRMLQFFEKMKQLKVLQVLDHKICDEDSVFDWDMSKIVISTRQAVKFVQKTSEEEEEDEDLARFSGETLGEMLRERYHLEMEMTAPEYVIAMTSFMDTEEGLKRLEDALLEIDEELCNEILQTVFHEQLATEKKYVERDSMLAKLPKAVFAMTLAEAMDKRGARITFADSLECISQEFVYLYPPGIPILAPGERITKEILERIAWYQSIGLSVQGLSDPSLYSIITVAEE